jgi:hypothetical protein
VEKQNLLTIFTIEGFGTACLEDLQDKTSESIIVQGGFMVSTFARKLIRSTTAVLGLVYCNITTPDDVSYFLDLMSRKCRL